MITVEQKEIELVGKFTPVKQRLSGFGQFRIASKSPVF